MSSQENEPIVCFHCYKTFSTKKGMKRHQRRSKICQSIQKLPHSMSNPLEEAQKQIGAIVIKTNEEKT